MLKKEYILNLKLRDCPYVHIFRCLKYNRISDLYDPGSIGHSIVASLNTCNSS